MRTYCNYCEHNRDPVENLVKIIQGDVKFHYPDPNVEFLFEMSPSIRHDFLEEAFDQLPSREALRRIAQKTEKRGAEKEAWLLYKFAATVKDLVDDVLEECGEEFEPEPELTEEQEARQM